MKETRSAKEKLMKILFIDDRLPKTSYVLRTFVGFYLIYIDYNIWSGLGEANVTNVGLAMAGGVFFAIAAALCIASGAYAIMNKEYREEKIIEEDSETLILEDNPSLEVENDNLIENDKPDNGKNV